MTEHRLEHPWHSKVEVDMPAVNGDQTVKERARQLDA